MNPSGKKAFRFHWMPCHGAIICMASLGEDICNMPLYRDTIGQHMNASAPFYRRDLMYMRPKFVSLDASVKATRDVNPLTYQTLLLLVVFVLYLVSIPSVSIHLY